MDVEGYQCEYCRRGIVGFKMCPIGEDLFGFYLGFLAPAHEAQGACAGFQSL
jgi:hypothetical protein